MASSCFESSTCPMPERGRPARTPSRSAGSKRPVWHRWRTSSLRSTIGAPGGKISPDAFLGAAVHAADITVDEQGTVAAAATALGFPDSGPPEPELTVVADRPFVYLIRHRSTGLVLFAGHVTDPT